MNLNVGFAALTLIPEFSGEEECREIAFVYFREGCNDALRVLCDLENINKENFVLTFLKNKLKGDAFQRFSLELPSYSSIGQFLEVVKKVYDLECDNVEFWVNKMKKLYQMPSSIKEYSARYQELFQCAILGIQNNLIDQKQEKEKIEQLEDITISLFIEGTVPHIKRALGESVFSKGFSKNFKELVYINNKLTYERLGWN